MVVGAIVGQRGSVHRRSLASWSTRGSTQVSIPRNVRPSAHGTRQIFIYV